MQNKANLVERLNWDQGQLSSVDIKIILSPINKPGVWIMDPCCDLERGKETDADIAISGGATLQERLKEMQAKLVADSTIKKVLIPLAQSKSRAHWTLIELEMIEGSIRAIHYDSSYKSSLLHYDLEHVSATLLSCVNAELQKIYLNRQNLIIDPINCGRYIVVIAEVLAKGVGGAKSEVVIEDAEKIYKAYIAKNMESIDGFIAELKQQQESQGQLINMSEEGDYALIDFHDITDDYHDQQNEEVVGGNNSADVRDGTKLESPEESFLAKKQAEEKYNYLKWGKEAIKVDEIKSCIAILQEKHSSVYLSDLYTNTDNEQSWETFFDDVVAKAGEKYIIAVPVQETSSQCRASWSLIKIDTKHGSIAYYNTKRSVRDFHFKLTENFCIQEITYKYLKWLEVPDAFNHERTMLYMIKMLIDEPEIKFEEVGLEELKKHNKGLSDEMRIMQEAIKIKETVPTQPINLITALNEEETDRQVVNRDSERNIKMSGDTKAGKPHIPFSGALANNNAARRNEVVFEKITVAVECIVSGSDGSPLIDDSSPTIQYKEVTSAVELQSIVQSDLDTPNTFSTGHTDTSNSEQISISEDVKSSKINLIQNFDAESDQIVYMQDGQRVHILDSKKIQQHLDDASPPTPYKNEDGTSATELQTITQYNFDTPSTVTTVNTDTSNSEQTSSTFNTPGTEYSYDTLDGLALTSSPSPVPSSASSVTGTVRFADASRKQIDITNSIVRAQSNSCVGAVRLQVHIEFETIQQPSVCNTPDTLGTEYSYDTLDGLALPSPTSYLTPHSSPEAASMMQVTNPIMPAQSVQQPIKNRMHSSDSSYTTGIAGQNNGHASPTDGFRFCDIYLDQTETITSGVILSWQNSEDNGFNNYHPLTQQFLALENQGSNNDQSHEAAQNNPRLINGWQNSADNDPIAPHSVVHKEDLQLFISHTIPTLYKLSDHVLDGACSDIVNSITPLEWNEAQWELIKAYTYLATGTVSTYLGANSLYNTNIHDFVHVIPFFIKGWPSLAKQITDHIPMSRPIVNLIDSTAGHLSSWLVPYADYTLPIISSIPVLASLTFGTPYQKCHAVVTIASYVAQLYYTPQVIKEDFYIASSISAISGISATMQYVYAPTPIHPIKIINTAVHSASPLLNNDGFIALLQNGIPLKDLLIRLFIDQNHRWQPFNQDMINVTDSTINITPKHYIGVNDSWWQVVSNISSDSVGNYTIVLDESVQTNDDASQVAHRQTAIIYSNDIKQNSPQSREGVKYESALGIFSKQSPESIIALLFNSTEAQYIQATHTVIAKMQHNVKNINNINFENNLIDNMNEIVSSFYESTQENSAERYNVINLAMLIVYLTKYNANTGCSFNYLIEHKEEFLVKESAGEIPNLFSFIEDNAESLNEMFL